MHLNVLIAYLKVFIVYLNGFRCVYSIIIVYIKIFIVYLNIFKYI
jgi:hypothetical protein